MFCFPIFESVVLVFKGKKVLPSVSTSLVLAAGVGIAEAIALSLGSDYLMDIMAIPFVCLPFGSFVNYISLQLYKWFVISVFQDSPMRIPAEQFLRLRAYGAPPIVVALAAQGAFRGFKDTTTPLYAVGKYCNIHLFLFLLNIISMRECRSVTIIDKHVSDVVYSVWPVAGNVLNAILDPILIFVLGFGISGAAAATVISEYVTKCGKLLML